MNVLNKNQQLLLQQLKRYNQVLRRMGRVMTHSEECMLECFDSTLSTDLRRKYNHCEDPVCTMIMLNYESVSEVKPDVVFQPPPQEEKKEEVFDIDIELQRPQLCNGQNYDYQYDIKEMSLYKKDVSGELLIVVGEQDKYIDCVYSSKEDNINRKPHHYRRAYAESRGISLEQVKTGNLYVADAYPYNYGSVGGYYEKLSSEYYIKVLVKRNGSINDVLVHSSGASGKKWQKIGEVVSANTGYYVYDMYTETIVFPAKYAHSFMDRAVLFTPRKDMVKNEIKNCERTQYNIVVDGIGYGLRETIFRLLKQYNVTGEIYNINERLKATIAVPDESYVELMSLLDRFLTWRGFKMKIVSSQTGDSVKPRLCILPG